MRKWVSAVHEMLSRKQPLVMALILSQEGSTPRAAGTRMLIGADGAICGHHRRRQDRGHASWRQPVKCWANRAP